MTNYRFAALAAQLLQPSITCFSLLLYLNVVLKVNDVVLGCCVRSPITEVVVSLHYISGVSADIPPLCQLRRLSSPAICKFCCKITTCIHTPLPHKSPSLWTNCQYKRVIRAPSAYSDGWLLASPVDCKSLRWLLEMTVKHVTASLDFNTT